MSDRERYYKEIITNLNLSQIYPAFLNVLRMRAKAKQQKVMSA